MQHNVMENESITRRSHRIEQLEKDIHDFGLVLATKPNSLSVSSFEHLGIPFNYGLESIAQKVRNDTGLVVDLRDEQITEICDHLDKLFKQYREPQLDNIDYAAKTAKAVCNTHLEFEDRVNYLTDKSLLLKQRQPVILGYHALFFTKPSMTELPSDEFHKCLDFGSLMTEMSRSQWMGSMPKLYLIKNSISGVEKFAGLLEVIKSSLLEQTKVIEELLTKAIATIARGDEISSADKLDLSKNEIISLGITVKPFLINAINKSWYHNNISSTLRDMGTNTSVTLADPDSYIRIGDNVENSFINLTDLMSNDEFKDSMNTIQQNYIGLTNLIRMTSEDLVKFSAKIRKVPVKTKDGYCNTAIEDIATLISVFSTQLFHVITFVNDGATNLLDGLNTMQKIAELMRNYQLTVEKYALERGKK